MARDISTEQARRGLASYHFSQTNLPGVLARLGTVQYDPLNPVGRNPDLVFQARVTDYRIDDWQDAAYIERLMYDSWDKQACLVPMSDWPMRAHGREHHRPWHDNSSLDEYPDAVAAALQELDERGPLSSLDFEDRSHALDGRMWLGPTKIKRILRALWSRGVLVTHHRAGSRIYYDRAERVIPPELLEAPSPSPDEYYRWVIEKRHQAAGMLRPSADAAIWEACGSRQQRTASIEELVAEGRLVPLRLDGGKDLYHASPSLIRHLERPQPVARMIFVAPLDSILWDRRSLSRIFDFQYVWEVYKPVEQRVWGYYVLPVFFRDRFVARFDCRLKGLVLEITQWWWEREITVTSDMLAAAQEAMQSFLQYTGAEKVAILGGIDRPTKRALGGSRGRNTP